MTSDFAVAVHALVFLNHKQRPESSEQIAENVCTHPVRLRRILARLKKNGLLSTREGASGGYHFQCAAATVTLAAVADALSEKPVDVKYRTGSLDKECQIASGMAGIMDDVYGILNDACYERLASITIADIDKKIFR